MTGRFPDVWKRVLRRRKSAWPRLSRAKYGALVAAAVAMVAAGVVAVSGAVDLPGGDSIPSTVLVGVTPGRPLFPDQPPLPALTAEEIDRAHALASAHPLVQQARDGADLPFAETGVWTEGGKKVGAGLILRLPVPTEMEAVWPAIFRPTPTPRSEAVDTPAASLSVPTESPNGDADPGELYQRGEVPLRVAVAELFTLVDLRIDVVVEVSPRPIYTNNL